MSVGDLCGLPGLPSTLGLNLVLAAGALTGLSHCAGMCGPLVGAFALHRRDATGGLATPLVLYQVGRIATYALLGGVLGVAGSWARGPIVALGWQAGASVVAGLLVAAAGLGLLYGGVHAGRSLLGPLSGAVSRPLRALLAHPHPAAPVALGALNGLLPCGAVYAMAGLAAVSGDPLRGALLMGVFGLGTLPAMLAMGLFATAAGLRWRVAMQRASALVVTVLGVQLVLRGLAAGGLMAHGSVGGLRLW